MKKLIVFSESKKELPIDFFSLGENSDGQSVFETKKEIPQGARVATANDLIGLPVFITRKKAIETARDKTISAGVKVDENTYDSSPESSQKVAAVIALASNDSAFKAQWITKDNQIVELSLSKLKELGLAMMQLTSHEFLKARVDKDAIAESILEEFK